MTMTEFLEEMKLYGIPLDRLDIHINEIDRSSFSTYIVKENDKWSIYKVDERNNAKLRYSGDEESAFQELYGLVFYYILVRKYCNRFVTDKVIKTPYNKVAAFLKEKYGMDEYEAKETWNYLCQDFAVLNEFKYYVLNGEFVPDSVCVKRCNYSAKQIYETTSLKVIGAFNYLIYLYNNPKKALADLKAGLPK